MLDTLSLSFFPSPSLPPSFTLVHNLALCSSIEEDRSGGDWWWSGSCCRWSLVVVCLLFLLFRRRLCCCSVALSLFVGRTSSCVCVRSWTAWIALLHFRNDARPTKDSSHLLFCSLCPSSSLFSFSVTFCFRNSWFQSPSSLSFCLSSFIGPFPSWHEATIQWLLYYRQIRGDSDWWWYGPWLTRYLYYGNHYRPFG